MRRVALVAAAALAVLTLARLPAAWESGNALNHVSGVWMTLADDLARGTLYRPLHGDAAFGGTRYFPLAFALHAGLLRAGVPLLPAGYGLSLAAGIVLALGVGALLRAVGASRRDAAATAALAFAGFAGQHALAAVRGDLLPVGLSAVALALVARGPARGRIPAAAVALVLAFAAKPTALTAAAAAAAYLAVRGERRAAGALAALVAGGAVAVVAAIDALSSGRFLSLVGRAATAGAGRHAVMIAPLRLGEELALADPAGLALAAAAAAVLALSLPALARAVRDGTPDPRLLPAIWVTAAWLGALVVFATPGTALNHLVELEAASATLLGGAVLRGAGRASSAARVATLAAAATGAALALGLWRADLGSSRLGEVRAVVRALPRSGPILSEDPLVPLLAGESPVLLDPFALRVASADEPALVAPLTRALRRGAFPVVVLLADIDAPEAVAWYAAGNLGLPLVAEIRRGYRPAGQLGRYHLYVPRHASVVRRDVAR